MYKNTINHQFVRLFIIKDPIMLTLTILFFIFLLTGILGLLLTPRLVNLSKELHLFDVPDARKIHQFPVPRVGGVLFLPVVSITTSIVLVVLLRLGYDIENICNETVVQHFFAYMAGVMMLYTIGIYDDIHGVGYKVKFVVQILSATLLCVSGLWVADFSHVFYVDAVPWWVGMPVTVLMVIYVTNAMNLIDGIDGLASGLSCISLTMIAILCLIVGDVAWTMLSVGYLGVVMAFFYFNVVNKKYKTFMGDAGSLTLGFTLAFLVLHFWQRNPVWNSEFHNVGIVAISTLVIPMFDVVRVFASRIRDGRNPFLPDKNHIHHKLLRAGLSGHMTMMVILLMSIGFILSNYFIASYLSQTLIIVADVVLFVIIHIVINKIIARRENKASIELQYQRVGATVAHESGQ